MSFPTRHSSRRQPGLRKPAAAAGGFTLVELMIAITLGLAIVAGLAVMLSATSSSSKTNDQTSELQSNGRYALNAIKHELLQAGFRGYTWAEPNAVVGLGNGGGECGSNGQFISNIRQGIWGANDSNPFAGNCIPTAKKSGAAGGDILVVRRLDGTPAATLTDGTFYFRSAFAAGEVFRGTSVPTAITATVPLANFPVQASVYYVQSSSDDAPLVPALYRVTLQPGGGMVRELVASGIEQLQLQYGRRTTAPDTRFYDSFTAANCPSCSLDSGAAVTSTQTVWDEVDSVRIWILVRGSKTEPGYTNTTSYVMGDQTYTVNDGYRRQLFSTIVQLRN